MTVNCDKSAVRLFLLFLITADLFWPQFTPFSPGIALSCGIIVASSWSGNSYLPVIKRQSSRILGSAIICLGFGFNLGQILVAGYHAIGFTTVSIALTLLGMALGKTFGSDRTLSALICIGTAICGGSAIAAIAPLLRSRHEQTAVYTMVCTGVSLCEQLSAISLYRSIHKAFRRGSVYCSAVHHRLRHIIINFENHRLAAVSPGSIIMVDSIGLRNSFDKI